MKRLAVLAITLALALASVAAANAANTPHLTLDAVASEVAGKPVSVHCETNEAQWINWELQANAVLHGFTYISSPVVYIAPHHCNTLRFALTYGYREVGITWLSDAVATVVHEAVHQRGIRDECQTEKIAMSLTMSIAERHFGLTQTVPQTQHYTKTVTKVMRRKIAGKWRLVRVPTQVAVSESVEMPNPDYARFQQWMMAWHNSLPAQYQGC
jgi:hypothetical protein